MTNSPVIRLPIERINQLKLLADALTFPTMGHTIGYLLREQIAKGVIPDLIPGIEIQTVDADSVSIAFDDAAPTIFAKSDAIEIADALEAATIKEGKSLVNMRLGFSVVRAGNGIKFQVPHLSAGKMLTHDIAVDVARLIRHASRYTTKSPEQLVSARGFVECPTRLDFIPR